MLLDPTRTKDEIVQWIRDYFENNGPECSAVVGISGGKDSMLMAKLFQEIKIGDTVFALEDELEGIMRVSEQTKVNLPARIRMTTLYAIAQSLPTGGRVANTCNMSEDYVGYSTKYGDSAGDFSPLSHLMVHEVRQIGHELPISSALVDKAPSDGLCGKTDEDNLGFTYDQLDQYIMNGTSGDKNIDEKISSLHVRNLHKLKLMPAYGGQLYPRRILHVRGN